MTKPLETQAKMPTAQLIENQSDRSAPRWLCTPRAFSAKPAIARRIDPRGGAAARPHMLPAPTPCMDLGPGEVAA